MLLWYIAMCVNSGITKEGGGAVGAAAAPPLAENLSCTAYCYCTILRFTGDAIDLGVYGHCNARPTVTFPAYAGNHCSYLWRDDLGGWL